MPITDENYLHKLFIDQAKPALDRHSGSGPAPEGEIIITENGTHDVTEFATANVNVETGIFPEGEINITGNGTVNVAQYETAKVQVGEAGPSVNGYDIATMQKFVDARGSSSGLSYLYAFYTTSRDGRSLKSADLEWLAHVDLSRQTFADYMFYGCPFYGAPDMEIPLFDTSNITSMTNMFNVTFSHRGYGYYIKIPSFNISNAGNLAYFCYCASLVEFPNLDFSKKPANLAYAFSESKFKNTVVGDLILNTSGCTDMFEKSNITSIGTVTLTRTDSSATYINCNYMFYSCASLEEAPVIVTDKLLMMSHFLANTKITNIPESYADITLSSSDFKEFASNCYSLVDAYVPNTTNATRIDGLVSYDTILERIHNPIDFRNAAYASGTFTNCKALSYLMIKNLKTNLQIGSGTTWGHLLTVECLVNACYELRDTGSAKTLTVGTANLEKLAPVYVKSIPITDEMRADDDLVDEKLPFVVCDSTDEGATLISEYILAKNWQLK